MKFNLVFKIIFSFIALFLFIVIISNFLEVDVSDESYKKIINSEQYDGKQFINEEPTQAFAFSRWALAAKEMLFNKHQDSVPSAPVITKQLEPHIFNKNSSAKSDGITFSRLGHSTVLINFAGKNWLTDPIFSDRASPVQWVGPKRFHAPPISIENLPLIEAVIISHDHYDHLDYNTIIQLKSRVNSFIVPLGIADILADWGVERSKITELDWWQKIQLEDTEIISTPTRHFSGRSFTNRNQTLWTSWVLKHKNQSIYFSGDTSYFNGFKEIGERYGPFDIAFLETGAYNALWPDVHMLPKHTIQAFKDINGKILVPIHNSTFDLATHAWYDPLEQITQLAELESINLLNPVIGDIIALPNKQKFENKPWWKNNN